jgi:hypothetical protein
MIVAKAEPKTGGNQLLILGLSLENVKRLMAGDAIEIKRETHGESVPAGWTIAITYGLTELAIMDELRAAGMVNAETKTTIDPRLEL